MSKATSEEVWQAYNEMEEQLGSEELAYSLAKAMRDDMLEDLLAYIARMNDIKLSVEIEEHEQFSSNTKGTNSISA